MATVSKKSKPKKSGKPELAANALHALPFDVQELRVEDVYPDENQPRMTITDIDELADSMLKFGQLSPILVRRTGNTYRVLGGERRWTAAKFNDAATILARVADSDDAEASLLELADNQHVALTDEERSRGAQRAFTFDAPVDRIAAATGRDVDSIVRARRGYAVVGDPTVAEELTLDDLMFVDELADDAKAVARYLKAAPNQRAWTAATIRNERTYAEKRVESERICHEAGVEVLKQLNYMNHRLGTAEGATAAYIDGYGGISWLRPITEEEENPEAAAERERGAKVRQDMDAAHDARLTHIATTTGACSKQYERLAEAAWEHTGAFVDSDYAADVDNLGDADTNPLSSLSGFYVRTVGAILAEIETTTRNTLGYESGLSIWSAGSYGSCVLVYLDLLLATGYQPNETESERIAAMREHMAKAQAEAEAVEQIRGTCRVCGCTDEEACEGGCSWVEADLCSNCVDEAEDAGDAS